ITVQALALQMTKKIKACPSSHLIAIPIGFKCKIAINNFMMAEPHQISMSLLHSSEKEKTVVIKTFTAKPDLLTRLFSGCKSFAGSTSTSAPSGYYPLPLDISYAQVYYGFYLK
ncbi:8886_t:CDS:2, partial [Entrophospora sp. SA101]